MTQSTFLSRFGRAVALGVALLAFLTPLVWMVGTSLMPPGDYTSETPRLLPSAPTLAHYREVIDAGIGIQLLNSALVTLGTTLVALVFGSSAAYALARYRFPAKLDSVFLLAVLVIKLMPPIVVAVPLFQFLRSIGLIDTRLGLILANQVAALPFAVWMMLSYIRDIPVEIEEAAALDGATALQRLSRIIAPMAAPGLFSASVFISVSAWNEYLFALLFIQQPKLFTLPLYIAGLLTDNEILWGNLMAIGVLSSLPVILCVSFLQKNLLQGFAMLDR